MTYSETGEQNYISGHVKERIQEVKDKKLKKLDLSGCTLTEVHSNVWELEQLEVLSLRFNKLTNLPESITKLSNLTELDLRDNKLTNLPESITKLSNLTSLDLSSNQLTNLPESITKLSNLTELDLRDNKLTNLPESITKLSNLTSLSLYFNKLTNLPESITKLSNLTKLDLSHNQLTNLPESITKISNLTRLDLSHNQLTNLPESITKLSNLTKLFLSENQLTNLPESITKLSNLTKLFLSENQLTNLPESITKLSNLTTLFLSGNQLTNLPESITKLSNLTKLDLGHNQLTNLPESITKLSNLTSLNLGHNQLTNLPESITKLSNLTELFLYFNKLTNLPESITKLSNLTSLDLRENKLTTLPESITKIPNLTRLYLGGNKSTNLPEFIAKLSNLTALDLSENKLINLPESITKLSNLTWLSLGGNKLTNLPESITKLSNLTCLNLSKNKLTNLPESITKLSNLTSLNLGENQLTTLPESITKLSNLTLLFSYDNPLKTPPIEIARKGIQEIRNYFQQEREKGIDYIYEAKLLIVGEGGAGKTTLANKILDQNYQLKDEDTTKGIEVHQYKFQTKNQNDFHINIWDFGGQEIYHATHQFFLTKRSLYTLVTDTREQNIDFYYWLNVVELLSGNSPLLIIKNEKQERKQEINQRALQGQFTNIKEVLATNLKTNRGLEEIIREIEHHISTLPHIGNRLPKTWKQVREILESDSRNYISLEEYLSICEQNGFKKREYKLQLSCYLHDLGICLHFQDDPLLNKTVILKPEWGTVAVYKVLDNQTVCNNFGEFTKDDLTNIWNEEKYVNMRDELLQLMISFKLCYKIYDNSQTYIAPQLLTENQPEYDWDESNNLILRYTYKFLPKGIITQFIVAMHEDIEEQKYVWKSGVILKRNEARAEVIEHYDIREIKIRVSGRQKRDLMTIVTYELDKIHSSYNNRLKYNQLIPCNCNICQNNQNPTSYKFEILKNRINNSKETIECDYPPFYEVNIKSLIDDVINIREYDKLSRSNSYPNNVYNSEYYINYGGDWEIGAKETNNQFIGKKAMNNFFDKSRKIQNKDGNITGNVLGDKSNIEGEITTNPPPQKTKTSHEFGWLDFLTWVQNGQIIYYLISAAIGICLLIIYPKLFPSGFPKLIEKIQELFPASQVEIESDQNQ
jgi:small GTP-binding protein